VDSVGADDEIEAAWGPMVERDVQPVIMLFERDDRVAVDDFHVGADFVEKQLGEIVSQQFDVVRTGLR
jgi:hypothetical protein